LVIALDSKRIQLKQSLDKLRERKNELSDMTPKNAIPSPEVIKEAKEVKLSIQNLEKEYEEVENEFLSLYKKIPNIPTLDTPVGLTEDENVVVKQW